MTTDNELIADVSEALRDLISEMCPNDCSSASPCNACSLATIQTHVAIAHMQQHIAPLVEAMREIKYIANPPKKTWGNRDVSEDFLTVEKIAKKSIANLPTMLKGGAG